jgi:Iron-containing redox enzyme
MVSLPRPRGDASAFLLARLRRDAHELSAVVPPVTRDALDDDDLQLALYLCYELHYRGLPGVDERWEWEPSLLSFRAGLERAFESALLESLGPPRAGGATARTMDLALREVIEADDAPSLSRHLERDGTLEQMLEFVVHRSAYQLKEADPHAWAIPRLDGPAKAALVEIQADEYGGGRPERVHAELFAVSMEALGLDRAYGAYLDLIPGVTLATVNLMSMLGLHRRLRGAIVGHLAAFEMTSSLPNRRYANALRRLGFDERATGFFDEHVEADAVHENVAAVDLAGGLVRREPALAGQVIWGARALAELDGRWARRLLEAWARGASSLRQGAVVQVDHAAAESAFVQ